MRHRFRPSCWDALEDRIALRGGQIPTVGALGDSYTDEYRFTTDARHSARNWVEILSATRRAGFGTLSSRGLGEPRNQGYADNWARGGATSADLVANQLPGLTAQVSAGKIQYAWVFTGGDDFLYALAADASATPAQVPAPSTALDQLAIQVESNIDAAVHALLAASPGVRVVAATIPAVGDLPLVKQLAITPSLRSLVTAADFAIAAVDAHIAGLASDPRVAVADLASASSAFTASAGPVAFGGASIDTSTTGENYRHFFLSDGIHVGTVGQGLIADAFLGAIDGKFGAGIPALSPAQIVRFARSVPGQPRR